jgi:hypothetical protein
MVPLVGVASPSCLSPPPPPPPLPPPLWGVGPELVHSTISGGDTRSLRFGTTLGSAHQPWRGAAYPLAPVRTATSWPSSPASRSPAATASPRPRSGSRPCLRAMTLQSSAPTAARRSLFGRGGPSGWYIRSHGARRMLGGWRTRGGPARPEFGGGGEPSRPVVVDRRAGCERSLTPHVGARLEGPAAVPPAAPTLPYAAC